jgi:hypothetical protein
MTVSSSTSKVQYNGNGSLTVFAYTFKVFDQDDLTVIIRSANGTETTKSIGTHYTVSGVGDAGGGNVTMLTAPASGETITILRDQPLTQGLDLVPNDPFPAGSMEDALDKLTFMVQAHSEELDRAIKASKTNTIGSTEFTISAADRANKVFAFDETGELAVTQELGLYRGTWAAATTYSQRDLVKDSSNSNIYICLTAHTSSGVEPISGNADSAKWGLIVDAASAGASASAAAASAAAAAASEVAAAASEAAAAASETAADASETAAAASQSAAATSASAASTSATSAASSATAASGSASSASTSATNAATSAASAANSATTATTQATSAAGSASTASTAATTATTQASAASSSATAAAASASAASTSETNAASSASSAATSASAASASQTAAAASAAAAAASYDTFDDRYLGSKTADPTLDNDGNALVQGALYFNSTANEMRVYDGANWIAASSAGGASLLNYNYTATTGQTTFSGADDNAATLSYTQQNLIVTLNGIVLEDGTDYTASNGTSIVLATGAAAGDELNIVAFKSFTTADMVPASTGGTFSGNVTVDGALTVTGQANTGSVLPSADATSVLGGASNRYTNLYLSGGVYLGGTGAANLLDDYEEGSASMTWQGTGGTTSSAGTLYYRKIGSMVFCSFTTLSGAISATGSIKITGLPFVCNVTVAGGGSILYRNKNAPSGAHTLVAYIQAGSSAIEPWWASGGSYAQLDSSHFDAGNVNDLYFNFQYMTTA